MTSTGAAINKVGPIAEFAEVSIEIMFRHVLHARMHLSRVHSAIPSHTECNKVFL